MSIMHNPPCPLCEPTIDIRNEFDHNGNSLVPITSKARRWLQMRLCRLNEDWGKPVVCDLEQAEFLITDAVANGLTVEHQAAC